MALYNFWQVNGDRLTVRVVETHPFDVEAVLTWMDS